MGASIGSDPRVVVVTGASSGFGDLMVRRFAAAGLRVFAGMRAIGGRNAERAAALTGWAGELGHSVTPVELDVTSEDSVAHAIATVLGAAGRIDVLVNNAGIASVGPLEAFDVDQVRSIFETNVFGPLRVDKAVLPGMRARGDGLIVYVSSALGRVLPGIGGPYAASKWALEGLAESMGNQLEPFGVDVVILEPGSYPTSSLDNGVRPDDRELAEEYARHGVGPPAPRYPDPAPDPREVAEAALDAILTPAGNRPRRVVIGSVMTAGVAEFNAHYEVAKHALAGAVRPTTIAAGSPGGAD